MTKTELFRVLEHLPEDCGVMTAHYDPCYEAYVHQPVAGVEIGVSEDLDRWTLTLRGQVE